MINNIKEDRLKQRDDRYNTYHRELGQLPSLDADMIGFSGVNPIFILETKHFLAEGNSLDLKDFQHDRLSNVGNILNIPYFVVYYVPDSESDIPYDSADYWEFNVFPRNKIALNYLPRSGKHLSSYEYCEFLYKIKGIKNKPKDSLSKYKTKNMLWGKVKIDW